MRQYWNYAPPLASAFYTSLLYLFTDAPHYFVWSTAFIVYLLWVIIVSLAELGEKIDDKFTIKTDYLKKAMDKTKNDWMNKVYES